MSLPSAAPTDPGRVVARIGGALAERAAAARELARAITAADLAQAVALHEKVAALAAELVPLQQALATHARALSSETIGLLRGLGAEAQKADAAVYAAITKAGAASFALWLLSQGRMTDEALDELEAAPWDKNRDLVGLVGPGSWRMGRRLQSRGHSRVMVVDRDEPESVPTNELSDAALWNVHSKSAIDGVAGRMSWPFPKQLRIVDVGPDPEWNATRLRESLVAAMDFASVNQLQIMEEAGFYALKAGRNLANIARFPSIDSLRGAFAGLPAVVVAAGPSLDKNLHHLKALQGRAVIVAINQTVRSLRRIGVRADVVVAVDPLNISYHFEGTQPGEIGTLILASAVDPLLFQVPCDQIVTFASSPMVEEWIYKILGEEAVVPSGGTVSTAAMKLCYFLGCTTVISIGRDMALAGTQYYADSAADGGENLQVMADGKLSFASSERKMRLADGVENKEVFKDLIASWSYDLVEIPGFFGKPVKTTHLFQYEIEQVRRTVANLSDTVRFINATEGGAYLEGQEHMRLEEAAKLLPENGARDLGDRIRRHLRSDDQAMRITRMATALAEFADDLRTMRRLADEARGLLGLPASDARRAEITATLGRFGRAHPIVSVMLQNVIRPIVKRGGPEIGSVEEADAAERRLYTAVVNVAEVLGSQVEAAVSALRPTQSPA
jgi:Protein of unknown function DUF115